MSINFDEHFVLCLVGPNLWQAFNRTTKQAVSPRYTDKDAAIYYVEQELKQEVEENIHEMLGGNFEYLRDKPGYD